MGISGTLIGSKGVLLWSSGNSKEADRIIRSDPFDDDVVLVPAYPFENLVQLTIGCRACDDFHDFVCYVTDSNNLSAIPMVELDAIDSFHNHSLAIIWTRQARTGSACSDSMGKAESNLYAA
jgi:hypothetical protein